ncbi:helix-turn-helix transcriptional regulator [Streptomyces caniscabiei]|uniref:helix-turn-helix domain-containing protein n=1 Tax=Streptomyces caniscabiei TaxID=2746961 RepID=UPI0029AC4464|nr:helix-turn-helix transcriptional regulator [Streptomyces caniscabiei]MDX2601663.1 helix-turn-helix transcriptional regulator [Streptomyces caniscabiei]MDX2737098.1 helix-turn-helix transcriptional regulator [Streptomyces caniscabiei]MDX2777855.1 helix-turn-helix transcriptional regulator [Streptomyces caniscabiei]
MPDADRPQELPARLLTDPEMINACRVRDFARVFRLVKTRAGIYPSMIARRCDLTPSRVGEVIAGRRQLLHMDVIERIADGLRIPGGMLGLARRPWETPQALAVTEREAPQVPEPEERSAASLPGPDVDSILALATRTTLSPATLEAFRSSIEDYWRRDDQHGGEALRPAVVGQLRYVVGLLKESRPPSIQNGLYGIAAELARLTGWTYFDARQYNQARAYFTEALQLAKEIDDRQFMANVLACMSLQATYQDKPADSLALVTAAQDQARSAFGTTPRVLSMLSMREAFAHATLGSHTATHRAIGEAHRQFEQIQESDPDPSWVTYFDELKLIVDTGIAHGRLGEAATAEPLIADALRREARTNQRGRAFHAFWLARTQLDQGKLDQACGTATQALESASAVASERVSGHLREFYEQLAPHRQEPVALAFEARLRAMLPPVSGSLHP